MTKLFSVSWTRTAEADVEEVLDYLANDSVSNARNLLEKITQLAETLNAFPRRGRMVPELKRQGVTEYRELIVKTWRMIYYVDGHKVHVVSFLDGRRDVNEVLLARFLRS